MYQPSLVDGRLGIDIGLTLKALELVSSWQRKGLVRTMVEAPSFLNARYWLWQFELDHDTIVRC